MFRPTVFILARSKRNNNWSGYMERELTKRNVPVWRVTPNTIPRYRPERVRLVINYGTGTTPIWYDRLPAGCVVLNTPAMVGVSANKVSMQRALPEDHRLKYTTHKHIAQWNVDEGRTMVARTVLNGHSGNGIVLSPPDPLPDARLYTVLKQGPNINEYRIWFMSNRMLDVAQKKRWRTQRLIDAGIDPDDLYAMTIRANRFGWVFARKDLRVNDVELFDTIVSAAREVIDWGCVDVLIDSESRDWWIVETNTAPGLESTATRTAIMDSFMSIIGETI